jgi:hypothetical protein
MKTLIVAATICLPLLAGAQVLELTPGSACGAPGVGLVRQIANGAETWVAERREGKAGQYRRQVHAIGRGGAIVGRATYECTATGWALLPAETYCRGR